MLGSTDTQGVGSAATLPVNLVELIGGYTLIKKKIIDIPFDLRGHIVELLADFSGWEHGLGGAYLSSKPIDGNFRRVALCGMSLLAFLLIRYTTEDLIFTLRWAPS